MINRHSLYFAWLITMLATFGSLYYSEVMHFPPCNLCWYQRIAFYPLAIILGMAVYKGDKSIIPYAAVLASVGFLFALYHVLEQYVPGFSPINLCGAGADCKNAYVSYFGFIDIPLMSAVGFLAILFFLYKASKTHTSSVK